MSIRTRIAGALLAGAVCVATAAGCGGSDSGSSTSTSPTTAAANAPAQKLRVAIAPGSFLDLAPWIAQDQGFFAKHGLEVEATIPTVPFSQLPSTLGRDYDIILGTQPDLINAGARGIDLKAVGGVNLDGKQIPGSALVVPKGSAITSIKDIQGKTVGAPSTSGNNWLTLLCWADKAGVDPESIRGVEAPAPQVPDLLGQGRFDAALLFEPLLGGVVAAGGTNLGDSYQECFGEPMFTSLWLANGAWADEHKPQIEQFLAGLTEAKQYIAEHPDEARELYVKRSGLPAPVAERAPIDPSVFEFRPITVDDLQPWLDVMQRLTGFDQDVDLNKLVLG
jgi:NitT/TauT family transport system substrate-binding protein